MEDKLRELEQKMKDMEIQLAAKGVEVDQAKSQALEVARMVKAATEREIMAERQLRLERHSPTPTSSTHPRTPTPPASSQ